MIAEIESARQAARAGRWDLAERHARAMLARDSRSLDALEVLALARRGLGDPAGAEQVLRQAIAIAPLQRWPYGDLARLLIESGRPAHAEAIARQALAADAANADAQMLLGRLLSDRGMPFEGALHLRRAIALAGRHPDLVSALGLALSRQGQLDEARGNLEEAVAADPHGLDSLVALAEVEERAGRFAAASAWLDRADGVARGQGSDVALQRSVLLARMGREADALALLDDRTNLSGAALLQRGRLRDRLGDHRAAWLDWAQGKALIARQTGRHYPAEAIAAEARALAVLAAKALPREPVDDGPQPVFILGFPRSGTTLTEQIVAAHDAVAAGGELPFGPEMREIAGDLSDVSPRALRAHYLGRAGEYGLRDKAMQLFTDKMPLNEFHLPLIRLAFPAAKVIRVIRHPLDVLVSVFSHDMTHGQNCGYRIEDAARHLALMQRQVDAYRGAGLHIDHELRYEALVGDQEGETRALMAALGLAMQPAQLAFHRLPRHAPTPSYAQVREPLNDRSIGRWRNFAQQLEPIVPLVADTMATLGYAA